MIHMMDNCLAYEVDRTKEFAPIKNETGVDSLESARKMMQDNGICL
jgi:UDP-N-acetylglucosamine/UDP-N-acetylgalactosamine diphosphorylase